MPFPRRSFTALALAPVAAAVLALVAGATPWLRPAQGATDEQVVSYHGYRVAVPGDWEVVRLADDPDACVRFDRPAIYLGRPANQQDCPAHVVGRSAGLVVEPLRGAGAVRPHVAEAAPGAAAAPSGLRSVDGELQVAVEEAGVLVTGFHAPDRERTVRDLLARAELTGGGQPAQLVRPAATTATTAATPIVAPGTLTDEAFDTCAAPSQAAMDAWRSSPYKAVGIYISGALRACEQRNLTASWVAANHANGWRFLLIDVGLQAPCSAYSSKMSTDPATALAQGRSAAANAARAAVGLGFGLRSAIYADIEHYPSTDSCRAAVLSYVSGWTYELNIRGLVGGVYTSAGSGGVDLSNAYDDSRYIRPDHIWFARWNGKPDTDGTPYIAADRWTNHQRLHQYLGNQTEQHGGVTLNIDRNYVDLTVTPPPVTGFDATGRYGSATLRWALPAIGDLQSVVIRRNTGTVPPATPTSGTLVYAGTGTTATATGLAAGTTYTFRAWVRDTSGKYSPGADTRLVGTSTTAAVAPTALTYGGTVLVTGRVTRTDTGVAVAGQPVSLYAIQRGTSTWKYLARVTTTSTGSVAFSHRPVATTYYRWVYDGSPDLLGSRSSTVGAGVRPIVSAHLTKASFPLGGYTVLYGGVAPVHPGQIVYLQRYAGGRWSLVASKTLTSSSTYSFVIKPTARGTYAYRVVRPADADHLLAVSRTRAFTVG